ncbi:MAG: hypothetical protein IKJ52_06805 [Muribaculaceae bacterium]|nr:hypothetical protein [Muribaculaceae bacterium]
MKKIISSIFALAALMLFSADVDAQSTYRIYHDAEAFNLKGHVKNVITYSAPVKGGAREKKEEWSFNPDGGIKFGDDCISFVSRGEQDELECAQKGTISCYYGVDYVEMKPNLNQKDFYWCWDGFENGDLYLKLDSKVTVFEQLERSKFDEYTAYEESNHYGFTWSGKRVKEISLSEGWVEYKWQRGAQGWDAQGGGDDREYRTHKYDAKGNVIKTTFQYGGGDKWVETYTYLKFDSHGNWIKRKVKSTGSNPSGNKPTIETRTISYYE